MSGGVLHSAGYGSGCDFKNGIISKMNATAALSVFGERLGKSRGVEVRV